jgi:hypothetical protein
VSRFATFKRISGFGSIHQCYANASGWQQASIYISLLSPSCVGDRELSFLPLDSLRTNIKIDILLLCLAQNNSGMQIRRVQFDIFIGRDWIYIDTPASCVRSVFVGWWGRTERAHNGRMMMRFKVLQPQERCPTAASSPSSALQPQEKFSPRNQQGLISGTPFINMGIILSRTSPASWYINLCACA